MAVQQHALIFPVLLTAGSRFPTGRPAISPVPTAGRSFEATGLPSATVTAVPVYRPQKTDATEASTTESASTTISGGPTLQTTTLLTLEDIYKNSERKEIGQEGVVVAGAKERKRPQGISGSAFSSASTGRPLRGEQQQRNASRKLYGTDEVTALGSDLQSVSAVSTFESTFSTTGAESPPVTFSPRATSSSVSSSFSSSYSSTSELQRLSTTTTASPPTMVTKVVKTVRVRQRMRPGSASGFGGPVRRFPGRVRVIQRPVSQEYIKSFPEFATPEGEALPKEEEEEVKNALIDLKKIPDRGK